ncbi:MAG TPA: DUF4112 domain-containing protein [Thermoanaerobaculia bacterium]|nr:DUF4112 domain-containing protein [Thermoanaerobaculia bacterium]
MPPEKVHIPEVFEPDEKLPSDLVALRRFAFFMDEAIAIPGTKWRFGADAALGLIPGFGDIIGGMLSTWIVVGALRHRVPAHVIVRMVFNIVVDLLFGAVPVAGDLFDFLFEENVANMRLLEKHRDRTRPPRRTHEIALTAIVIITFIFLIAVVLGIAAIALIFWLIGKRSWV